MMTKEVSFITHQGRGSYARVWSYSEYALSSTQTMYGTLIAIVLRA